MGILKHYKLCTVCNFFYRDDINTDAFFLFKQSVYTKCLYCERDLLVVKYYDNHIRDMHSYGSNVTVVFPPEEVHFGPVKFEKEHFDERRCIYFDGIDLFYIHSKIIDGDDIGVKRIGGVIIKQGIKLPSEISFDQKEIFIYEFIVTDGSYFEKK